MIRIRYQTENKPSESGRSIEAHEDGLDPIRVEALAFDWDGGDLRHLGCLMAKLGLDLATAIRVFLNGQPERFNYLDCYEVPLEHTARVALLDCLHKKISCGFYLPDPNIGLGPVREEAGYWLARQSEDRKQGQQGRWVFDETRLETISDVAPRPILIAPKARPKSSLLRTLFEPIWLHS
ncbi:hypothetical protein TG4357_03174 [Thalassovita gelatinovora]|uniref:Uncharacterized protein n=1 Tax=Thalassovita gelatinovora TaxID=53501 RepID=A0A0P1FIU0_THAGE|nr:hypothetical protein [Thalassovita gelatinovora]QIZ82140.1 hypothetical protein HFZ77_17485 [Thalassovita gelatinovora]CUH67726.1 hypothetical protein TG4357_03174 [Thalassovita gelatinovora]SEP68635.1 hypothetical protein SAMN04488043_10186 [Thalassovita gelatinovora]